MNTLAHTRPAPPLWLWPILVGGAGFAAGFFGPIALLPDSNIAPIIGIFFTGPGGALLGLLVGLVAKLAALSGQQSWRLMVGTAALLAVATLGYLLQAPEPKRHGHVIDAVVRNCHPASAFTDERIAHWEERIAKVTWAAPRTGWKEQVPALLANSGGVVLTLEVTRQNTIYEQRKIWNKGELRASAWSPSKDLPDRFFVRHAGDRCADYPASSRVVYFTVDEMDAAWPPTTAPAFLGLLVAQPPLPHIRTLLD